MQCSACLGPFHPATGHEFSERTRLCGPCARDMMEWVRLRTSPRGKKSKQLDFYLAAGTSIRAK